MRRIREKKKRKNKTRDNRTMKNNWRTFGKNFSFHWRLLREVLLFLKAPFSSLGKGECVQSEAWGHNPARGEITGSLLGQRRREDGGAWVFSLRVWTSTGRPGTNPGSAPAFPHIVLFALMLPCRVS